MDPSDTTPSRSPVRRQWRGGASPVKRAFIVDRRKRPARRLTALATALCEQLGRPLDALSEVERARVMSAAHLMLLTEQAAADAALGKRTDVEQAIRLSGALSRALDDLGLSPAAQAARRQAEADAKLREEARRHGVIVHD
jgi:hypothetical protein